MTDISEFIWQAMKVIGEYNQDILISRIYGIYFQCVVIHCSAGKLAKIPLLAGEKTAYRRHLWQGLCHARRLLVNIVSNISANIPQKLWVSSAAKCTQFSLN